MLVSGGRLVTKTPVPFTPATADWFWDYERRHLAGGYGEMYRRQLWVYVVVHKRALATARLPGKVYRDEGKSRPEADGHPLQELMRQPNPAMSPFRFWEWTSGTYDTFGHTFWLKRRRPSGAVDYLAPLHPTGMTPQDDGTWDFTNGKTQLTGLEPADLVHFKSWNPGDPRAGLSALEPLRATLENESAARTATSAFWRNGARPGVALKMPGNLSPGAAARLKEQWRALAAGAGNTGETVILEEGLEPAIITLSAEEAQYIDTRRLNREEVCAAFDIPPPVVHILDRATFSNITEQMRSMYRDTMAPHLKGFEADIATQLTAPDFGDDVYFEFLLDEVLRGSFEARAEAYQAADWMTLAEKREKENLPFIEGTDRIFVNAAIVPLDEASRSRTPPAVGDQAAAEPAPDLEPAAARSVMGRLSWQKSLDDVDAAALIVGLNGEAAAVLRAVDAARAADDDVRGLRARIQAMAKGAVR